jgi:hypothetical protein
MDQQYLTPSIQKKGVEWFQQCIELDEQFDYYFYKGMCLYFTERTDEAREAFLSAGLLSKDEEQEALINQVMQFINRSE